MVAEERLRIAQEVHDLVAHAMVAISVQAGTAAHVLDSRPEQARTALRAIKGASDAALTFEAGPEGLDVICIGGRKPKGGDTERFDDFWD